MGEYTGVIEEVGGDSTYSWSYPTKFGNTTLMINGIKFGNHLRFVNDLEEHNLKSVYSYFNGKYGVYYVTTRNIKKGE